MASQPADSIRRLAALVRGRSTAEIAVRWRLSNADAERLEALAAPVERIDAPLEARATRRLLHRWGAVLGRDLALLAWAEAGGAAPAWRATLDEAARWSPKDLPIKGADVMALGVPKGPEVGRLLAAVEDWWIERDFAPDRAACLAELKRRV